VRINTGNLEILHATIKTLQGAEDFTVRLNDTDATTASVGRHIVKIGGTVTTGDVVTETINGTVYSYTPAEGDTPDRIANGLRDAILSNPPQGIEVGAVGKGTSSFTLLETRPGATFSGSTLSSATVAALIAGGAGLEGLDAQQLIAATETIANAGPVAVGGNVSLLGPGGDINVGTTAVEVNPKLSNSSLGILTLNNGGIDVFTDGNVLVNQSRILTVQGGDLFMWSSNGDLDAGRGAKTTVDFKPLSVNFDPRDLQTINLNGLVSGAGIGTIQSTPDAPSASISLVTPRGKINAGDAGLRASGDVNLTCGDQRTQVTCIINAANIVAFGSVTGVPTATVDIAGLESTSSVAGQAAQAAADAVAAASNQGAPPAMRPAPSLISVEVLGFGDCDPEAGMRCTQ